MSKAKNPKVRVSVPDNSNPYRATSTKFKLFNLALKLGEFTKEEFLAAVKQLRSEEQLQSVMSPEVWSKAWWNEFKNKHKVFVDVE